MTQPLRPTTMSEHDVEAGSGRLAQQERTGALWPLLLCVVQAGEVPTTEIAQLLVIAIILVVVETACGTVRLRG
ncbi:hypothetical protein [Streptomyces halstedii]|uniref:hypothetical protein n=1 Tax=Streptomyces halstedii TaxID=1944 RepID=UPI0033B0AE73